MKRTLALTLILALSVSMAGALFTKAATANPLPPYEPPAVTVSSPSPTKTYNVTSILLTVKIQVFAYTYQTIERIGWLSYSLDGRAAIPLTLTYPSSYGPGYYVHGSSTLPGLSNGKHTLVIQGETTFNEPFNKSVSFAVDTVIPAISVLSPTAKTYTINSTMLEFAVSKPVSWIGYTLDGQETLTINGNTTLTGLSEGSHYLVVQASDAAGNVGASNPVYFSILKEIEPASKSEPELVPTTFAATAFGLAVAIASVSVLVYFKKRNHQAGRS